MMFTCSLRSGRGKEEYSEKSSICRLFVYRYGEVIKLSDKDIN